MKRFWSAWGSDVLLGTTGLIAGLAGGVAFAHSLYLGIVYLGGCMLLALAVSRPVALAMISLVGVYAAQRIGGGGVVVGAGGGVSISDVLLVMGATIALPSLAVGPELRRLKGALAGLAFYLVALLPTVLLDDSSRGWLEWGHRLFLVGGAMIVGAWLARERLIRPALRVLVAVSCVVAVLAILNSVRYGLEPASPLGLNKNFVGAQLSMALIVVVVARRQVGLRPTLGVLTALVVAAGLISTQSRGSMIAAAVGIVFVAAFEPRAQGRGARGLVLLVTVVLAGFVFFSIRSQLSLNEADLNNSSIGVRRQVEKRTLEIWRTSPVHGVGLKYFNSGEWGPLAQVPNVVVDNELAESGVIGLGGFVVLQGAAIGAGLRRRRNDRFVVVGTACVAALLVHGLVDIYWIAGSVTLPFLILGMGLGSDPLGRSEPHAGTERYSFPSRLSAASGSHRE